jgi:hypothetical protein
MNLYNVRSKVSNNVCMTIMAENESEALEIAVKRWDWDSYAEYCAESYDGKSDLYTQKV